MTSRNNRGRRRTQRHILIRLRNTLSQPLAQANAPLPLDRRALDRLPRGQLVEQALAVAQAFEARALAMSSEANLIRAIGRTTITNAFIMGLSYAAWNLRYYARRVRR